jgi:alanine racemase
MVSELQVWAEIDLSAYRHNIGELKKITAAGARFMAVVKADGYGHGAVEVSRVALESGADCLGVARLEEGLQLRHAGIAAPILIFGYTPPRNARDLIDNDLTQTVFSYSAAEALAGQAERCGRKLRAQIKVDTGMGRLGVLATETSADQRLHEVQSIASLSGLEIEGLYTHFATADSADASYAELQLRRLRELLGALATLGLEIPIKHAANSAALMHLPDSHLDLVRPGIATYGLQPSSQWQRDDLNLEPVLQWKTRIIHLKKVPAGFGVSYGITYKTSEPTTLAIVPVGYADGLNRALSSRGQMLVEGRRVPIVGRVCMDLTILDVGEVPGVSVGDEVVVLGRQGERVLTAEDMAATLDTINYEIVTSISQRVPRIYVN